MVDNIDRNQWTASSGNGGQLAPEFAPSIDNLVPALYLKGISTGDFPAVLEAILGHRAPGLSATNVVRLKKV